MAHIQAQTSQTPDSEVSTDGVRIHAAAQFLPHESDPDENSYLFAYRITMSNEGTEPARLKRRHWVITDAEGNRNDVEGPGVVGEYPTLDPGESFEYVSTCPLPTPWGTMEGEYRFERLDGRDFDVQVGRFFLVPSAPSLGLGRD